MTTKMEQHQQQQISGASLSHSPQSPSFTTFSSENIADIAARVLRELNLSHDDPFDDEFYSSDDVVLQQPPPTNSDYQNDDDKTLYDVVEEDNNNEDADDEDESEFEFAILCGEDNSSPISADEIFSNGQIKPIYPVFDTNLAYGSTRPESHSQSSSSSTSSQTIRLPLRKLLEEGNGTVSCSSSEADDLEGVPPGTYCVWTPQKKEEMMMRKKSKSTGNNNNSKRWKFRDLLFRSNSDGKDTFVFLTPNHQKAAVNGGDGRRGRKKGGGNGGYDGGNNSNNKKSYLPYRQDLVGLFSNVNGISRTVRPF